MFVCECGKEYETSAGFNIHKSRFCVIHKNTPKYKCDCGKSFVRLRGNDSLREHRKTCDIFKEESHIRLSRAAKNSFQKLSKDPERLKEIRENAAKKISETIMSNPKERKRRSDMLAELNKTQEFRDRASETAKKTSARPEILKSRTAVLRKWTRENPEKFKEIYTKMNIAARKWREQNPEEFYERCVKPMLNSWKSEPEKILFCFCKNISNNFSNTLFLKHKTFTTKTKKRQIDIFDPYNNIIIEFDGPLHFKNIFGEQVLGEKIKRDKELNCLKDEYCIIRVSYEYFNRTRKIFDKKILKDIEQIILNKKVGLYKFGELYGKS